jgi:gas vesicle protein
MSQHCNKSLDFLLGAVLGGLLGGTASILMAPKSGRELREDLSDTYDDMTEKAHELANHMKHNSNGTNHDVNSLVLGGLAGATIGTITALLATPKSGKDLRDGLLGTTNKWAKNLNRVSKSVARNAGEHAGDFKEIVKEIAEKLMEKGEKKYGASFHNRVDDILDFANIGLRLIRERRK